MAQDGDAATPVILNREVMEQWLEENQHKMIRCPYQPGGLLISMTSCIKRHEMARGEGVSVGNDRVFRDVVNNGLSFCRRCPLIKNLNDQEMSSDRIVLKG